MQTFSPNGIAQLAAALALAQGEIRTAAKDSNNPHFGSKYADLASVWGACREPLSKHGLSVVQTLSADGNKVTVSTALLHKSGEWISDAMTVTSAQSTPQAVMSCVTYARRYSLASIVGVAPDDDDGNAAAGHHAPAPAARPTPGPSVSTVDDLKARYTGMRVQLVNLFGETRTRTLMKEWTDACGQDREAILTKMREAIAEEERQHPMATGGK